MNKIIVGATGAFVLGLAALGLLTTTGVFSGSGADAATGVNDPINNPPLGTVFQVSVDMDTTGNPAGNGGLLSALDATATAPVGTDEILIDVIVDEVHPTNMIGAFGFNLRYDPAVIKIVSKDYQTYMLPAAFELVAAPIPDSTGSWRIDAGELGGSVSGEGVLVRIGIECIADGVSPLDLGDDRPSTQGDLPNIIKPTGSNTPVQTAADGSITCGAGEVTVTPTTPTVTPTNPAVTPTVTPTGGTPTVTPTGGTPTVTPATPTVTPTNPVTVTPTITPQAQQEKWGDSDCDGEITTRDNQALLRRVLSQPALSQTEPCPDLGTTVVVNGVSRLWGDWDCDGEITTRDNQALLRFVLSQAALNQTEPCPDIGTLVAIT